MLRWSMCCPCRNGAVGRRLEPIPPRTGQMSLGNPLPADDVNREPAALDELAKDAPTFSRRGPSPVVLGRLAVGLSSFADHRPRRDAPSSYRSTGSCRQRVRR
jgi:hypothetical protein